jgi:3-hydroxyacyl-CoA dehydrogenase
VVATDPGPNAEDSLRRYVNAAWKDLTAIGLSPRASVERLEFTTDMKKALSRADFVQENGPERPDFKIKLFAEIDEATPHESIIASSSSGITMSVIQSGCKRPGRCLIGHPFNPPHMVPLVEVVGGSKTSPEAIEQAMSFYASIGKKPIRVRKEVPGHVANRLQAALQREIVYLIDQGVVDVADADTAVSWGPGLRWGVMGPNLLFHLAGGEGGIQHALDHLSGPMASWWKDLGTPTEFTPKVKQTLIDGALREAGDRSIQQLEQERDDVLMGLLKLRTQSERRRRGQETWAKTE